MKTFFTFLLGFGFLSSAQAEKSARTADSVKKTLAFTEGTYTRVSGNPDNCQGDLVDLHFEPVEDQLTLVLGERFIFGNILIAHKEEPSLDNCEVDVITDVVSGKITQTRKTKCKKASDSGDSTQILEAQGPTKLRYTFVRKKPNGKKVDFRCEFVIQRSKQGES